MLLISNLHIYVLFAFSNLPRAISSAKDTVQRPLSLATPPLCPEHSYSPSIISHSPLLLYIPSFLTPSEITHLQSTPPSHFTRSGIADSAGIHSSNATTRTSQSTSLSHYSHTLNPVEYCIAERARRFQSRSLPRNNIEPLQLVKYAVGQEYHEHTDWFTNPQQTRWDEVGGNRVSSFFVYVEVSDDIIGGGTRFSQIDAPGHSELYTSLFAACGHDPELAEEWCSVIDCDEPWDNGVTVLPREGAAVFWVNMLPLPKKPVKKSESSSRRGDERTLHAGLPVLRGRKMGMNIWTREGEVGAEYRGV